MKGAFELDIGKSLEKVNIFPGDTVMIHGNAGVAAQYRDISAKNQINYLLSKILEYIGQAGTVVVPTFSYSFTKGEDFNPKLTPSRTGSFSEAFRLYPGAIRSKNPLFSVAAIGSHSKIFQSSDINDSFGSNTCFGLINDLDGKIISLGDDIKQGITYIHYVEQACNVSYRYMKKFNGNLILDNNIRYIETTYYVRDLSINSALDLSPFRDTASKEGLLYSHEAGRFPIMTIGAKDCSVIAESLLIKNSNALISERLSNS